MSSGYGYRFSLVVL